MGRVVQPPSATGTHRLHPASRSRGKLLAPASSGIHHNEARPVGGAAGGLNHEYMSQPGVPPAGPAGGWKRGSPNPRQSGQPGLTQANRPPRNPVRFRLPLRALTVKNCRMVSSARSCGRVPIGVARLPAFVCAWLWSTSPLQALGGQQPVKSGTGGLCPPATAQRHVAELTHS